MKTAYIELVKKALYLGYTVSVWDGEEWQVKRSNLYKAIVDAIESVEQAQVRFRNCAGEITGWALIIPFGVDPEFAADGDDDDDAAGAADEQQQQQGKGDDATSLDF